MKIDHHLDFVLMTVRQHLFKLRDSVASPGEIPFRGLEYGRPPLQELPPEQIPAELFGKYAEILLFLQRSGHCAAVLRRFLQRGAVQTGGWRFGRGNLQNPDLAVFGQTVLSRIGEHELEISRVRGNPPRTRVPLPAALFAWNGGAGAVAPVLPIFVEGTIIRDEFQTVAEFLSELLSTNNAFDRHHLPLEQSTVDGEGGGFRTPHPQERFFSRLPNQFGSGGNGRVFRIPLPENAWLGASRRK